MKKRQEGKRHVFFGRQFKFPSLKILHFFKHAHAHKSVETPQATKKLTEIMSQSMQATGRVRLASFSFFAFCRSRT